MIEKDYALDFSSIERIELPVRGPDNEDYILREATGDAAAVFNNARAACVQFADGKMSAVKGPGSLPSLLVSLCLWTINADGKAKDPVKRMKINSWPDRVVEALYDKARDISEIDRDDDLDSLLKQRDKLDEQIAELQGEDPAKNELEDLPVGSD